MRKYSSYIVTVTTVCLKNLAVIALFMLLANVFKTWWISLFALLFQTFLPKRFAANIEPKIDEPYITCSFCGEVLCVKDIEHAVHREMQANDWNRFPFPNGWLNVCPHCIDQYRKLLEEFSKQDSE